ncbi:MAG: tRNA (N(6)-L-threonylcarbamoyladenosine(37)-C(2))-methylthiotransferase MtaB [Candidatus Calescibacterium sp.]|nr:tRNA (N(6)-L-threonylcarbamoyladenosine(37)-C(2))-methylthiotransferase MtaB [Candidatus Calescibacterium sp.]MCX7972006.1 tRNA (N(6)-L-threonylcarbamoyladenosine(37)-C(2))-methylthiotransferase MtaB [bacterium]MDW8195494.1 tRNA (N(6)-L-threonylcarbamoyladenosine(37)-C(2))-methylthiotransferase MtaB [Candidatus Calescibacterium sp.]
MKFSTYYLGCRVNQAEIEYFEEKLSKMGLENSKDGKADIIIFNTCAVTHKAEKESFRLIRKVFLSNPDSKLFITGCIVPLNKSLIEQVKQKILPPEYLEKSENIYIIPSTQKEKVIEIIENHLKNTDYFIQNNGSKINRFKYYIKVQDGCNHFCSFCIIPFTRGRSRSKKIEEVQSQIQSIAEIIRSNPQTGAEITLTGICLGEYGLDINTSLAKLLKSILPLIPDNARIRLSSMDIITLDEELMEVIATSDKICKFLHLSLQSGSNRILKLMRRNYTIEQYIEITNYLYKNIPDLGITTDIIVGFPTETDQDFEETLEAIKKVNFHRIHIFPFSFRPYTYAYQTMRHIKIDHQKVKEYEKILTKLSLEQSKKFIKDRIGKYYNVLVEENGYGYTHNFIRVKTNYSGNPKYMNLKITGIEEEKGNFAVASVNP